MFAPTAILVPTDFSEFSDNALRYAVDIGRNYKSRVYLLHVVGIIQQCSVDYCLDGATVAEIGRQSMEASSDMMKKQMDRLTGERDVEIVSKVIEGAIVREILREQEEKQMDLIVMGSRGRTGILNHFGSVADAVSRAARCPVLIVKDLSANTEGLA